MTFSQAFFQTFGASPFAVVAYLALHAHLYLVGRRLTRLETLTTNAAEMVALTNERS
jgi:hypothetical protein